MANPVFCPGRPPIFTLQMFLANINREPVNNTVSCINVTVLHYGVIQRKSPWKWKLQHNLGYGNPLKPTTPVVFWVPQLIHTIIQPVVGCRCCRMGVVGCPVTTYNTCCRLSGVVGRYGPTSKSPPIQLKRCKTPPVKAHQYS